MFNLQRYMRDESVNLFIITNGTSLSVSLSIVHKYKLDNVHFIMMRVLDCNDYTDYYNIILHLPYTDLFNLNIFYNKFLKLGFNLYTPHLMSPISRFLSNKCKNLFFIEEGSNNFWSHLENNDKWKYNNFIYRFLHRLINKTKAIPTTLSIFDYHHPKYRHSFSLSNYTFVDTKKIIIDNYSFNTKISLTKRTCFVLPSKIKDRYLFLKEINLLHKYYINKYDNIFLKLHPANSKSDVLKQLHSFGFKILDPSDLIEPYISDYSVDFYSNYSSTLLYSVISKNKAYRYNLNGYDYEIGKRIDKYIKHNNLSHYYERIIL